VIADRDTGRCAIIDPVLNYDEKYAATATSSADALLAFVRERKLTVEWILDTHPMRITFRRPLISRRRARGL
jgi:glyoxylase-like metal-dependent hydrolase (beta-lactamase superfamily II)